jgi:hypothetical protein
MGFQSHIKKLKAFSSVYIVNFIIVSNQQRKNGRLAHIRLGRASEKPLILLHTREATFMLYIHYLLFYMISYFTYHVKTYVPLAIN